VLAAVVAAFFAVTFCQEVFKKMSKTCRERELSATELARAAGIRLDGLYVTLRSGKIPARKDSSGEWKISAKAFKRYMLRRSGKVTA
jgi:hypothetical protein